MKRDLARLLVILGALVTAAVASAQVERPVVLKGLDPVLLVGGKEVPGKPEFSSTFGRYRYLFSSAEDKTAFDKDPQKFGVQRNGMNIVVAAGVGNPDFFTVYKGMIFLAGSQRGLDSIKDKMDKKVEDFFAKKSVAIVLFPGVQIIDYSGPYEVFGQANYQVYTVSADGMPIVTAMGQQVVPDFSFDTCPEPTILLTPGGNVPMKPKDNDATIAFIKNMSAKSKYTMSVCNGAYWLANAGLLDGKEATTYYGMVNEFKNQFPKIKVLPEVRFTDNGSVMTTSGLSSGIDGALKLVAKLEGEVEAKSIALNMEYDYRPNSGYSRAALADKYMKRVTDPWDVLPDTGIKVTQMEGSKEHWVQTWELTNPKLSKEILVSSLEKIANGIWTKKGKEKEATRWSFKADDGAAWSAWTNIEEVKTKPGTFLAKFTVMKG